MAKLMNETSETLRPQTCEDLSSVTFSQALAAGHTHCGWLVGPTSDPSGREAALANRGVQQASETEQTTTGTCGRRSDGSSSSAGQMWFLESKSHRPKLSERSKRLLSLSRFRVATTPKQTRSRIDSLKAILCTIFPAGPMEYVQTWKRSTTPSCLSFWAHTASAHHTSGNGCGGWATPKNKTGEYQYSNGDHSKPVLNLEGQAKLAGWPTATTRDHKDGQATSCENVPESALLGRVCHAAGTGAETASGGAYRLNPRFSLWLMGYPAAWASCGARAMQSSQNSRRRSSRPQKER